MTLPSPIRNPSLSADERDARVFFSLCPSIGPARFRKMEEAFGGAQGALSAGASACAALEGMAASFPREWAAALPLWDGERERMTREKVRALVPGDGDWPAGLKALEDAPYVLYMKGTLRPADDFAVALVGTRRPSPYGRAVVERLARELAQAGVCVVSGLARGIDTYAHQAALKEGGRSVGILGSGFGRFYPPENKALAERLAAQGAVLTEHPRDMEPRPENFPRRNRLIAAVSLGVVVVESDLKSGALITAGLAARQGREVFAVPGSVFAPGSRGPHALLKQGAHPVEDAEDVLEAITLFRPLLRRAVKKAASPPLPVGPEGRVLSLLRVEPAGRDRLAERSGLAPGALASALLSLEMKGLIRSLPGGSYARIA